MAAAITLIKAFWRSEAGTTALEYGIIGAGLSITIIGGAKAVGVNLSSYFTKVQGGLS